MDIVIRYLNFNSRYRAKCTFIVKLISLTNTSDLFSLEVVQNVNFVYYGKTRLCFGCKLGAKVKLNMLCAHWEACLRQKDQLACSRVTAVTFPLCVTIGEEPSEFQSGGNSQREEPVTTTTTFKMVVMVISPRNAIMANWKVKDAQCNIYIRNTNVWNKFMW